jgi:hypothetical protein
LNINEYIACKKILNYTNVRKSKKYWKLFVKNYMKWDDKVRGAHLRLSRYVSIKLEVEKYERFHYEYCK